ncbi:MAG: SpvB/TcaC N-terminal domain-containing protein, partial [Chloroflexota bacterium]
MPRTSLKLKFIYALIIIAMIGGMLPGAPVTAVSDPSEGNIDDVPSTTPANLGDLDLTELQYGDPAEALDLVQPPKASVDGSASLAYPLQVPPGRAGVQPDLALTYSSNGGSGWVGTGWDLSVGAITVDTAFGAPRYLPDQESETYLLNGDRLFPNAIRTVLDPRNPGPRADWVRQIEEDNDLIIRHGDTPSSYCWEVVDTEGNHFWYGGAPDANGNCVRDASAILTADATGVPGGVAGDYHWALTYVEDISGNIMRFSYDKLTGVGIGRASTAAIGVSLYLREIRYTGFRFTDAAPDQPAYVVRFLRDGDVTGETARRDVTVDASAGQPVVTRDLLRGIQVEYLGPEFYSSGAPAQLVQGWTLEYENGPFDKSLLTRVGQYGSGGPGTEHSWHEFTWFDDVTNPVTGEYEGFGPPEQWGNRTNTSLVNIAAESALGTSWRAGAEGGVYIGFNPVIPSKTGSFGGSFNIAGGQQNEVSVLVDLDGDSLPDKVWVNGGGTVMYRPNMNRPGALKTGDSWFGPAQTITGIDSLGRSSDLNINLHFEAYPVVAIQVGGGFGFSFGDRYFEDVNGDGRVDFIKPGSTGGHTVFYNVLDDNGVPMFIDSSLADQLVDRLEVPLDAFDSTLANAPGEGVEDLLVNTSPRIDTVRRWLAPHTGTIRVQGTAELVTGDSYRGDGAQVTIENGGGQQWTAILNKDTISSTHDIELDVSAGEPVWFRLHVIDNAADDEVSWDPTITYLNGPNGSQLSAALDANGRSQVAFDASE